jgi:hypothetical protein
MRTSPLSLVASNASQAATPLGLMLWAEAELALCTRFSFFYFLLLFKKIVETSKIHRKYNKT